MPVVSALFAQMDSRKQKIVLCSTSGIVLYLIYINLFVLKSWRCSWQHEPFVFPSPAIPIAENSGVIHMDKRQQAAEYPCRP